jgi:hypothetical protein
VSPLELLGGVLKDDGVLAGLNPLEPGVGVAADDAEPAVTPPGLAATGLAATGIAGSASIKAWGAAVAKRAEPVALSPLPSTL